MNTRHWNTVGLDGTVDDPELRERLEHSSELVVSGCRGANEIALSDDDRRAHSVGARPGLIRHTPEETVCVGSGRGLGVTQA